MGRFELLFDKRNNDTPAEVVFESGISTAFHYAFVAALVIAPILGLFVSAVILAVLAATYLAARGYGTTFPKRRHNGWLRHPVRLLHRNFTLLFCCYLAYCSSPTLPRIPLLLFGAIIDSFREYRIARAGSGSQIDQFLLKIESAVQRALVPAWWFIGFAICGLLVVVSLETADGHARLQSAAAAFSWIPYLAPQVADLPRTLGRLGVPEKYGLVLSVFGYSNTCGLLYLFLAFMTQQQAEASWVKWDKMTYLRSTYSVFVGVPVSFALHWAGLHIVDLGTTHLPLTEALGSVKDGNVFLLETVVMCTMGSVAVAVHFFAVGAFRRLYG